MHAVVSPALNHWKNLLSDNEEPKGNYNPVCRFGCGIIKSDTEKTFYTAKLYGKV